MSGISNQRKWFEILSLELLCFQPLHLKDTQINVLTYLQEEWLDHFDFLHIDAHGASSYWFLAR